MSDTVDTKTAKDILKAPIFKVPPFVTHHVLTGLTETQDWGLNLLNVPSLWRTAAGQGIKVAVLDTGIALDHPDLMDSVIEAKDFTNSPQGVDDIQGHGTHCAGIIAARQNTTGIVGVAPQAELLIAKVLGDNGSGSGEAIVGGIRWAIEQGADIISMSLGAQTDIPEIHDEIKAGLVQGAFFVCAAGNDALNHVDYPAAYDETIAVGSINKQQVLSDFSSIGPEVTIVAPGEDILSTYPPKTYARLSGTSMAAPFVSGVVALILSKHRLYDSDTPVKSQQELMDHLAMTAIDLGEEGFDIRYGWGLVNPEASVLE